MVTAWSRRLASTATVTASTTRQQANVTTLPSGGGAGTVTIASPGSTTLQAVTAVGVPALPVPPSGAQFPAGVLGFKVAGVDAAAASTSTVHLPAGSNPSGYLKLLAGAWVDFSSHVTINGDVVTLHLVDNDAFDTDSAVGVIGDPGAPVVGYKFSGFRSPIDVLPAVNSAKGGQAIPVKWRITTAAGVPVSNPSSFVSLTSSGGACGVGATDEVEAYAPGASGLQYLGNGEWQMNWKTEKAWAGQCRTLTLKLADGLESRTASFKFKSARRAASSASSASRPTYQAQTLSWSLLLASTWLRVDPETVDPVVHVAVDDRMHPFGSDEHTLVVVHGRGRSTGAHVAQELGSRRGCQRLDCEGVHRHAFRFGAAAERVAERGRHPEVEHRCRHAADATAEV